MRRLLAILLLFAAAAPARAADLPIEAFFGRWQGAALSETDGSIQFQLTARDLDVQIAPAESGFALTWTTIQRQKGEAANPRAVSKAAAMNFVPADRPAVWRMREAGDPLRGLYAWARVRGRTLTVTTMQIDEDGGAELQIYDRTLTDLGMELQFRRLRDGEAVRTAKGRLVKTAN